MKPSLYDHEGNAVLFAVEDEAQFDGVAHYRPVLHEPESTTWIDQLRYDRDWRRKDSSFSFEFHHKGKVIWTPPPPVRHIEPTAPDDLLVFPGPPPFWEVIDIGAEAIQTRREAAVRRLGNARFAPAPYEAPGIGAAMRAFVHGVHARPVL